MGGGSELSKPVRAVLSAVVTVFALAVAGAFASSAVAAVEPAPGALRLQGSNGYTVAVTAYPAKLGSASQMVLVASRKGSSAAYVAPAKITPTSFEADFGSLGRVAVAYRPVGGVEEFVGMCGEDVFFQAGFYEGVIEFHGEGGFTDVSTTWARGRPTAFPCGGTLYTGGTGIDGAVLTAISFRRERQFFFEAHRNSPSSPAVFNARLYEANGDVAIVRSVRAKAAPGALTYGSQATAPVVVRPPRPFSGSAVFRPVGRRHFRWRGDLAADFPGMPAFNLTHAVSWAGFDRHTRVIELRG